MLKTLPKPQLDRFSVYLTVFYKNFAIQLLLNRTQAVISSSSDSNFVDFLQNFCATFKDTYKYSCAFNTASTTGCLVNSDAPLTDRYTQEDCPESVGAVFSIIIYVIYLIFLNILLVNLLIAIFK